MKHSTEHLTLAGEICVLPADCKKVSYMNNKLNSVYYNSRLPQAQQESSGAKQKTYEQAGKSPSKNKVIMDIFYHAVSFIMKRKEILLYSKFSNKQRHAIFKRSVIMDWLAKSRRKLLSRQQEGRDGLATGWGTKRTPWNFRDWPLESEGDYGNVAQPRTTDGDDINTYIPRQL